MPKVLKPQRDSPQVLEPAVDRFDGSVGRADIEVRRISFWRRYNVFPSCLISFNPFGIVDERSVLITLRISFLPSDLFGCW